MVLLSKFWNLSKNIEKTIHAKNRFQVHRYRKTFNFGAPILKWEFSKTFNINGNTCTINKAFTVEQMQFQNTPIKATHLTKKYTQTHHSLKIQPNNHDEKPNTDEPEKQANIFFTCNRRRSSILSLRFWVRMSFFYGTINFFQVFFGANQSFVLL